MICPAQFKAALKSVSLLEVNRLEAGKRFACGKNHFGRLMRTDTEGRRKSRHFHALGHKLCPFETERETLEAACPFFRLAFKACDVIKPGQMIINIDFQRHLIHAGQFFHGCEPRPVFFDRGDIAIGKEKDDSETFLYKPFKAGAGAGCAAAMQQNLFPGLHHQFSVSN